MRLPEPLATVPTPAGRRVLAGADGTPERHESPEAAELRAAELRRRGLPAEPVFCVGAALVAVASPSAPRRPRRLR